VHARLQAHTHHPNTRKYREIYKKTSISIPAKTQPFTPATSANHGQAEKDPTSTPLPPTRVGVEKHL